MKCYKNGKDYYEVDDYSSKTCSIPKRKEQSQYINKYNNVEKNRYNWQYPKSIPPISEYDTEIMYEKRRMIDNIYSFFSSDYSLKNEKIKNMIHYLRSKRIRNNYKTATELIKTIGDFSDLKDMTVGEVRCRIEILRRKKERVKHIAKIRFPKEHPILAIFIFLYYIIGAWCIYDCSKTMKDAWNKEGKFADHYSESK